MSAKEVVESFWTIMMSNDFFAASRCLSPDYELSWPQSAERIVGPDNFAAVNTHYPANGVWQFEINSLVAEGETVVSDVTVTDGVFKARAITFSTVRDDKIVKQIEFWPDHYDAPDWRKQWVEPLS